MRMHRSPLATLAAMLVGAALVAAACTGSDATPGDPAGPRTSGSPSGGGEATPGIDPDAGIMNLDHLIFIVQENRSFDHYFGTYPGADGIPMDAQGRPRVCAQDPVVGRCVAAVPHDELVNAGGPHNHEASVISVNGGKMDGFIEAAEARPCIRARDVAACGPIYGPEGQPDIMAYHDDRTIPNYWAYADRVRAAGRDVRAYRLLDAARPISSSSQGGRPDAPIPTDAFTCSTDLEMGDLFEELLWYEHPTLFGWTDITWLLHRHDVSWAYYAGGVLCRRPAGHARGVRAGGPGPAPERADRVRRRQGDRPARQHQDALGVLRRRAVERRFPR